MLRLDWDIVPGTAYSSFARTAICLYFPFLVRSRSGKPRGITFPFNYAVGLAPLKKRSFDKLFRLLFFPLYLLTEEERMLLPLLWFMACLGEQQRQGNYLLFLSKQPFHSSQSRVSLLHGCQNPSRADSITNLLSIWDFNKDFLSSSSYHHRRSLFHY